LLHQDIPNPVRTFENYPFTLAFYFMPELFRLVFFAPSEKNPPIEEQLYLFMKRFHTQPSEFFAMERSLRLQLYARELKLLKEEAEAVGKYS
jgi:hypothetical protein